MKKLIRILQKLLPLCAAATLLGGPHTALAADGGMTLTVENSVVAEGEKKVPATLGWLAGVLREKGWTVVIAPGTQDVLIPELKLKNADLRLVSDALSIATSGTVRAAVRDPNTLFVTPGKQSNVKLEAFSIAGYLREFGDEKSRQRGLQMIEVMVHESLSRLADLSGQEALRDLPGLRFYQDAKIVVVIGKPEAIEVARKIIEALAGQSARPEARKELLDLNIEQ